jgi:hypothetical protein
VNVTRKGDEEGFIASHSTTDDETFVDEEGRELPNEQMKA